MENIDLNKTRHSAAHLLAMAVLELRPDAKLAIGPVIDAGFYYDFDLATPITPEDLPKLEQSMQKLIKQDFPFTRTVVSRAEAEKLFQNQPYKLEIIADLPADEEISVYESGGLSDLCAGPHVEHSGQIGAVKVLSIAGAYWRGDEKKQMLQRIYGTAFATQAELADYITQLEEAKKRDHRILGQKLDLFIFSDLVGAGLPLFTPKGNKIRELLVDYIQSLQEPLGYERVWIPHIAKAELYKVSGHWDKFKDDLFHVKGKGDDEFVMKPMNCPHHNQIFASKPRSYRDLPVRYSEVTTNYRDEQTGELQGLSRVRSLTQDDGHVYCTPDQVLDEVNAIYGVIQQVYKTFNMPLSIRLSLRDPEHKEKYLGSDEAWESAENQLKEAMSQMKEESFVGVGEAAFYGPKLDFMATDAIGRQWQVATIQLDFNQPERFKLMYADSDGQEKQVVMIHRAVYGSLERFMSIMIEHFAGDFPLWLAPVQAIILPISEKVADYATTVLNELKKNKVRVILDDNNESIGKKIRNAETQKIPLMLIVGQQEADANTVSVRSRSAGDLGAILVSELLANNSFGLPSNKK